MHIGEEDGQFYCKEVLQTKRQIKYVYIILYYNIIIIIIHKLCPKQLFLILSQ